MPTKQTFNSFQLDPVTHYEPMRHVVHVNRSMRTQRPFYLLVDYTEAVDAERPPSIKIEVIMPFDNVLNF